MEEPSCIRRPDTGQQSRGFRVLYWEPQYKRKRVEEKRAAGPCDHINTHVLHTSSHPEALLARLR